MLRNFVIVGLLFVGSLVFSACGTTKEEVEPTSSWSTTTWEGSNVTTFENIEVEEILTEEIIVEEIKVEEITIR